MSLQNTTLYSACVLLSHGNALHSNQKR
jgi:hypothetical protein